MVDVGHGDMLERRRGGVDVLRFIVKTLAMREQSGAVLIRRTQGGDSSHVGWLMFRLGQPVMAFHTSSVELQGLEALLAIEADALDVNNEVELYELTMSALRATMAAHPKSVLHLEHQAGERDGDSWWSSVRLPSTSWRRAARLEDIEELALSSEHRRRVAPALDSEEELQPGGVYLFDSPDPHPMIQLAVELAERGVPVLGLFGLPHASTDITKRLPSPQCYALLSPHGEYRLLDEQTDVRATVDAFQWGNERSLIVLDGLDRLGNAFGDNDMLDIYRSIADGVRFNDHIVLCTTDLEMFDTRVRHALLAESHLLRSSTVDSWLDEPDHLWDHPFLLAPDEEEEQWLEAQIRHQGAQVGGPALVGELGLEGGSIEVDDATRESATQALSEMVSEWSPPEPSADVAPDDQEGLTTIGATSWRPVTGQPVEGRYVSESPRLKEHDANEVDRAPRPARKRRAVKASAPPAPSLRKPQRLPSRKPEPALPSIGEGVPALQSSAVVSSAPTLPDWPAERRTNRAYRKENMDGFEQRQERAIQRQSGVPRPLQTSSLRDNVNTSPNLEGSKLPAPSVPRTVELPSVSGSVPLSNSVRPLEPAEHPKSREAASLPQHASDIDAMYEKWTTFEEPEGMDATALYNEKGEPLERYSGGSS